MAQVEHIEQIGFQLEAVLQELAGPSSLEPANGPPAAAPLAGPEVSAFVEASTPRCVGGSVAAPRSRSAVEAMIGFVWWTAGVPRADLELVEGAGGAVERPAVAGPAAVQIEQGVAGPLTFEPLPVAAARQRFWPLVPRLELEAPAFLERLVVQVGPVEVGRVEVGLVEVLRLVEQGGPQLRLVAFAMVDLDLPFSILLPLVSLDTFTDFDTLIPYGASARNQHRFFGIGQTRRTSSRLRRETFWAYFFVLPRSA